MTPHGGSSGRDGDHREPVVVKIATTPIHAKVVVALLKANDIPAYADSDSLADEFAMSRKLMNLAGVKITVPAAMAERAREILQDADISEEDLAAQAIAAAPEVARAHDERQAERSRNPGASPGTVALWCLGSAIAASALTLWNEREANAQPADPHFLWTTYSWGLGATWRDGGARARELVDDDHDRTFETIRDYDRSGKLVREAFDRDADGTYERVDEWIDGVRMEYRDTDGDMVHDTVRVHDTSGAQVLEQRRDGRRGWRQD
ncbi:MAG: hypothetical protein AB7O97_16315 [Planctomycetota bacterium]